MFFIEELHMLVAKKQMLGKPITVNALTYCDLFGSIIYPDFQLLAGSISSGSEQCALQLKLQEKSFRVPSSY